MLALCNIWGHKHDNDDDEAVNDNELHEFAFASSFSDRCNSLRM